MCEMRRGATAAAVGDPYAKSRSPLEHSLRSRSGLAPLAFFLLSVMAWGARADDRPLARDGVTGETFAEAVVLRPPVLAFELVLGLAYEGTAAIDVGWLVPWVSGLEVHGAAGIEINPALRLALSLRYVAALGDFQPYVSLGVVHADLYETGSRSTQLALELGHRFTLGQHTSLSVGAGARVVMNAWLDDGSPLLDGTLDPDTLSNELDAVAGSFAPVVTLRLTRAF
jgi:hypothetical protein